MSLPPEFWENLSKKTDAELYEMLAHSDDYEPDALEAAKEELHKRNLAPDKVARLESVTQSQKTTQETRANEPLGWPLRILIFVLCSGISGAIFAVYYDSKGFKRKAKDCWITLAASLAIHILVALIYSMGPS